MRIEWNELFYLMTIVIIVFLEYTEKRTGAAQLNILLSEVNRKIFGKMMADEEANGKLAIITEGGRHQCGFCKKTEISPRDWGHLFRRDRAVVHYFCLLFSSGLEQMGPFVDGIQGYLPEDIKAEIRRAGRLTCLYCKQKGASIGCAVHKCKVKFHYPCGVANGTLSEFLDPFHSFCPKHKQKRRGKMPSTVTDYTCILCVSIVTDREKMVWSECCKTRVFHKECIRNLVDTAGKYSVKCPHCNEKRKFRKAMQLSGIYIPPESAVSWETEANENEDIVAHPAPQASVSAQNMTPRAALVQQSHPIQSSDDSEDQRAGKRLLLQQENENVSSICGNLD